MPADEMPAEEKEYVLGTHDDESERLGLQHRVWRPRVLEAWRRAGFTVGQTILDVGCGPGHATIDLAEMVGPAGRVLAFDRSRRFLDALETSRRARGLANITTTELDFEQTDLPRVEADGAWMRWVFIFANRPREVIRRVASSLKRGGAFVLHEYLIYDTWRLIPQAAEFEELVQAIERSWRDTGGEPDVGMLLPGWLEEAGFEILSLKPIVEIVGPSDYLWQWPAAFVDVGLRRLVDIGQVTPERAAAITRAFHSFAASPHARMVTPSVVEIIAARR